MKKENTKLKRELAQARKKNNRLSNELTSYEDDYEIEIIPIKEESSKKTVRCEQCNSKDVSVISVGVYDIFKCQECSHTLRLFAKEH